MPPSFFRMPPGAAATADNPPAPLVSSWRVRADAGEPIAVVRVRNLQGAVPAGRDAWGRGPGSGTGRGPRPQPVLLSSEVSFARPFATASAGDRLGAETVHYGTLSKALLGGLDEISVGGLPPPRRGEAQAQDQDQDRDQDQDQGRGRGPTSSDVSELLWVRMTGRGVDGSRVELPPDQLPLLDAARLSSLSLSVRLPKASLLGAGVSLTTVACFRGGEEEEEEGEEQKQVPDNGNNDNNNNNPLRSYSRTLRIHGLHVPTLVGVNPNERKARQMVIADVEIDRYDVADDIYADVEKTVVEVSRKEEFAHSPPPPPLPTLEESRTGGIRVPSFLLSFFINKKSITMWMNIGNGGVLFRDARGARHAPGEQDPVRFPDRGRPEADEGPRLAGRDLPGEADRGSVRRVSHGGSQAGGRLAMRPTDLSCQGKKVSGPLSSSPGVGDFGGGRRRSCITIRTIRRDAWPR